MAMVGSFILTNRYGIALFEPYLTLCSCDVAGSLHGPTTSALSFLWRDLQNSPCEVCCSDVCLTQPAPIRLAGDGLQSWQQGGVFPYMTMLPAQAPCGTRALSRWRPWARCTAPTRTAGRCPCCCWPLWLPPVSLSFPCAQPCSMGCACYASHQPEAIHFGSAGGLTLAAAHIRALRSLQSSSQHPGHVPLNGRWIRGGVLHISSLIAHGTYRPLSSWVGNFTWLTKVVM